MSCVVCRVSDGSSHQRQRPSVRSDKPRTTHHNRRRAFTLIEILIVVGIIGLLTAIAVIGFRVVGGATRSKVTAVALENCKGLLASYKETTDINQLLDAGTAGAIAASPFRWQPPLPASNLPINVETCSALVPGTSAVNDRYLRDETARVIRLLSAVPANRKSIDAMSADRLIKVKFPVQQATPPIYAPFAAVPSGDPLEYAAGIPVAEGINVLDGSGKPIYFIPGGGLQGVNVGYVGKGDKTDPANYDRANQTVRAPDHAPFWASPGPDGDLTTGDDNAYSFGGN